MKQLIISCKQFHELNEEQQKKVLDEHRDMDSNWLTAEDLIWDLSDAGQTIADAGFIDPEVVFQLDGSQGEGACFDCSTFNYDLLLEDLDIPHKSLFKKILDNGTSVHGVIKRPLISYAHLYVHEKCRSFYINCDSMQHYCPRTCAILAKIRYHIEHKRYYLCLTAKNMIQEAIDFAESDEHLKEVIKTNGYYFREDNLQIVSESELTEIKEENCEA